LYEDAETYDILHAPGTAAEVRGLERMARRWLPARRGPLTWLEPACGTGRYLRALARRGHRVCGFDRDPGMVQYAKAGVQQEERRLGRRARGRVFVAEMTSFAAGVRGPVDVAFNLINTIRHLGSDRAMVAHLRQVQSVLRAGGLYIVGISLSAYGREFPSEDVWEGARGRVRVTQVVQYEPPPNARDRRERVFSHLVVRRGGREEHRDTSYELRCYSREEWERLVARAGFAVEAVVDEEGEEIVLRPPGYGVWLLRNVTRSGRSG
jgi:SAM-dependent methyltransferase